VAIQKPGGEMEIRPIADDPLESGDLLIVLGDPEVVGRLTEWSSCGSGVASS
jgi:K+/H+ antiporter YhaU regulatory subunit KhtT